MKNSKIWVISTCVLLVLAVSCGRKEETATTTETPAGGGAAAAPFDPATGTAALSGKITFEGEAPKNAQLKMDADPVCKRLHKEPVYAQEVLVENGNLQNVFVYVKEGLEKYTFTPPAEPATIDQHGCQYTPHVGGMMVSQKLQIINSDPTLHNIHCWAEKNPQFNIGQPVPMKTEKTFANPEVLIHFKCDVHKWMSSYLGVLPHPYYSVTGKDGAFSLKNLPPGEYVIEAWHEKYGTQTQKITVADKDTKELSFTFKAT